MNTAVIMFKGGDPFYQNEQLESALTFEGDGAKSYFVNNYDELDEEMYMLESLGVENIVVYHPKKRFFEFEEAMMEEYGEKFSRIEVLQESFSRLNEDVATQAPQAQGQAQGQNTQQPVNPNAIQTENIFIFPCNPAVKGAAALTRRFETYLDEKKYAMMNLVPDHGKNGMWTVSSNLLTYAKGCSARLAQKKAAHFTSIDSLYRYLNDSANRTKDFDNYNIFTSNEILQLLGKKAESVEKTTKFNITWKSIGSIANNVNMGLQAFNVYKQFMSNKKFEVDEQKVTEFKEKYMGAYKFFIKVCSDMEWCMTNWKDEALDANKAEEMRKQWRDRVLKQLGVNDDLATMNKNLRNGGAALMLDAISAVADKIKTEKEINNSSGSKTTERFNAFLCSEQFTTFANCFEDFEMYIEEDK